MSTLVKWFPDRRGMATGMAIMGFGGGAMIGAPLADLLMNHFRTATSVGVWQTFLAMGAIYFVFMLIGAFGYRLPPMGWHPDGWTAPGNNKAMITQHHVHLKDAHKTRQFWLIWAVLCLNVSTGIGVIGMASPMLQEIFGGSLIGHPELGVTELGPEQRTMITAIAAGFTGLLSLFICNLLVKPLADKWFMKPGDVAVLQARQGAAAAAMPTASFEIGKGGLDLQAALFWALVGIPIAWGIWVTLSNAMVIFG